MTKTLLIYTTQNNSRAIQTFERLSKSETLIKDISHGYFIVIIHGSNNNNFIDMNQLTFEKFQLKWTYPHFRNSEQNRFEISKVKSVCGHHWR